MVFRLIVSSEEKMLLVFLKTGLRMDAKEYLDQVLKGHVFPWNILTFPDPQEKISFQFDQLYGSTKAES